MSGHNFELRDSIRAFNYARGRTVAEQLLQVSYYLSSHTYGEACSEPLVLAITVAYDDDGVPTTTLITETD